MKNTIRSPYVKLRTGVTGKLIFIVAITLLPAILIQPVYCHMPLTGKWIGDYLVETTTKAVEVGEEVKVMIHLGNMKLAGFAPHDLNITVEFLQPDGNLSFGRYEAQSWATLPELYGQGPGYYKASSGPVFNEPGRYILRVRISGQGEADFEMNVIEQSRVSSLASLIENTIKAAVVGVIGGYILLHLWRRRKESAKRRKRLPYNTVTPPTYLLSCM